MKETIYNYDYLKESDITEVVIRMKALIINNEDVVLGNENNILQLCAQIRVNNLVGGNPT